MISRRFSADSNPLSHPTSFTAIRSTSLLRRFCTARLSNSPPVAVSAANATTTCPGRLRAASPATMSSFSTSVSTGGSPASFVSFPSATSATR